MDFWYPSGGPLDKIKRCGLIGGDASLGVGFEVISLCLLFVDQDVNSQLVPSAMPDCLLSCSLLVIDSNHLELLNSQLNGFIYKFP